MLPSQAGALQGVSFLVSFVALLLVLLPSLSAGNVSRRPHLVRLRPLDSAVSYSVLFASGRELGVGTQNIRRVTWGMDVEQFRPGLDATPLRRQLGLAQDAILLFSARALDPRANVDVIIRAFAAAMIDRPESAVLSDIRETRELVDAGCSAEVVGVLSVPPLAREMRRVCRGATNASALDDDRALVVALAHRAKQDAKLAARYQELASFTARRRLLATWPALSRAGSERG